LWRVGMVFVLRHYGLLSGRGRGGGRRRGAGHVRRVATAVERDGLPESGGWF
jgi:hypothetical protein